MRFSIEPRDRICVKSYGFFSFIKSIGKHATKVAKSMSNKYSQKLLGSTKKSTRDAIKTASRRAITKTAETTGDLIGKEIAGKITSISKSPEKMHSVELRSKELDSKTDENEVKIPKEWYISPKKRQQIIDELRLV